MSEIQMSYDVTGKRATLIFPNGRMLEVGNITEEQAKVFKERHAAEFMKRDCCLHSVDGTFTRDGHE